jgi:hypothetical protein
MLTRACSEATATVRIDQEARRGSARWSSTSRAVVSDANAQRTQAVARGQCCLESASDRTVLGLRGSPAWFVAAGDVVGVKAHFRSNGRDQVLDREHRLKRAACLIKANGRLTVSLHHLPSRRQHCAEPAQELVSLMSTNPRSNL